MSAGKGSAPRPYSVSFEEFDKAFDAIFKKGKEKEIVERGADRGIPERVTKDDQGEVSESS